MMIFGRISQSKMLAYMRKNYPHVWNSLGRSSFVNSNASNTIKLTKYFGNNDYKQLNDKYLNKLVLWWKVAFAGVACSLLLFWLSILIPKLIKEL